MNNDLGRVTIAKMELSNKVFYALLVSLLCFMITRGDPKRVSLLKDIQLTDEKLEYIFQTTLAVQTKTFRQRITVENKGVWKLIADYVNQEKWMEIEVELKTRIGIKLNSIFYDKVQNNMHIDFGEPSVLGHSYTAKPINYSDGFFSKWSIGSFEEHKDQFLKELLESESKSLVQIFRRDSKKMSELEGEYYSKILNSLNFNYNSLAPEILIWRLNQYMLSLISNAIQEKILSNVNSSYYYTKQLATQPVKRQSNRTMGRLELDDGKNKVWNPSKQVNRRESQRNSNYHYSHEEKSRREQIRRKLQL